MVRHILRKDVKLLWPLVAGVLGLYILRLIADAAGWDRVNHGELASLAATLALAAMGLLVVFMVQKDSIPGVRQDWLVRPVRRRDLMLAKIAFAVLAIALPVFIADFINGLLIGFPPGLAWNAAFAQDFRLLFEFLLPLVAFATLTSSLMQALVGAIAIALCVILCNLSDRTVSTAWFGGVVWIPGTIESVMVLLFAGVILALQYYRRRTLPARFVCGLAVAGALLIEFMPRSSALAIQESLSTQPDAAREVRIRFAVGDRRPVIVSQLGLLANMDVPLDIAGVGPDETLVDDRTESRIVDSDGAIHPLGQPTFNGHSLSYEKRFTVMAIPRETLQAGVGRLEIDYWLTLLRMTSQQSIPPNSTKLIDGIGVCSAKQDANAVYAEVICRQGASPALISWSLEGSSSAHDEHWPEDYSPFPGSGLVTRQIRFGLAGMRDRFTWDRALAEKEIHASRVVMKAYEPLAHFKRHLSIPVSQLANAATRGN